MRKIAVIQECINSKYLHSDKTKLTEKDKNSKGKNFELDYPVVRQQDINFEIYRFTNEAFPYFSDVSGLKANCDYVIFAEHGNLLYVLIFELKKGNESAKRQLEAANEFIKYIIASLKRIGKITDENIHIRKIRISQDKINRFNKKSSKEVDAVKYVDNYCDYPYSSIYLESLMQY